MGVRGEIFSQRVVLPNRTYFFNIKENRMGDIYLNIVESKNRETGGFERQSLVLFAEDLQEFLKGFDESLHKLEDLVRQKRRGVRSNDDSRGRKSERGAYSHGERNEDDGRGRKSEWGAYPRGDRTEGNGWGRKNERGAYPRGERKKSYGDSDRPVRSYRTDRPPNDRKRPSGDSERSGRPTRDGKRVVVRKNREN